MQPLLKAGIFAGPGQRVQNNPVNVTRDMFPAPVTRPIPYGDGQYPDVVAGLTPTKAPQQSVIFRPGSRDTGRGSYNVPGDRRLILSRQVTDQIGSFSGSTLPMGSQGMNTSLSDARKRAGRG